MSRKEPIYGIVRQNILVHAITATSHSSSNQRTSLLGVIVKIENIFNGGNIGIRFLDKIPHKFEDSLWLSNLSEVIIVAENFWPLLLAIPSPMERVALAQNASLCDQLASLKTGNIVEVLYNHVYYKATIKYIGPIEAMGNGWYLGLALSGRTQITKHDGSYADTQYFHALPGTGLFVSIDKLRPVLNYLSTVSKRVQCIYPTYDSLQEPERNLEYKEKTQEYIKEKPRTMPTRITRSETEMDLIELLGGSWPGVTDEITDNKLTDNKYTDKYSDKYKYTEKYSSPPERSVKVQRNKSLNPVSHIISSKKVVKVQPKNDINATAISDAKNEENDDIQSDTTYDIPAECSNLTISSVSASLSANLSVGTLVEVITDISDPLYGVVRYLGSDGLAGVELEEDQEHLPLVLTDGTHNGQRYFSCANGRALFVPISQCQKDSRFQDMPHSTVTNSKMFGQVDSPVVPGAVPPLSMPTEEDVLAVCGKYRGIQGHHNSCYLDATLFAMFTYTGVFDSLLFRPRTQNDIAHYEEVQRVLREEIVNPLRQNLYVRADRVMKLRTLLEDLSSVSGLTSEEKDPEEFLNSLLAQILKAEPFLKLSSGQEAFHYQLFVEKDEGLALPSVQQLFEQSFLSSDIKLKEVPSCLIIQMPRFGKSFKMYPRILPSQLLDVTDIIENSPRQCTVCGKLAQYECKECFGQCGVGLESTGFCANCLETAHCHVKRTSHSPKILTVPQDFAIIAEHCPPPRLFMELFAVVCIETSHYVAFVKCGSGHEAPWCFFDSMADRKGEQNGYNIPEMVACPDVSKWLSDDGAVTRLLHEAHPHDKQLPEHARRLLCDAYICMYQSPDVMMYR